MRIAAIISAYHPLSHADVIVGRWFNQQREDVDFGWFGPRTQIESMYVQQFPEDDIAREISQRNQVPMYETIAGALTCGGDELAVDAVMIIGEHGKFPFNELNQELYPRKEYFDQVVKVFQDSRRTVPVFCDKFYSWNYEWAKEMVDTARRMGFMLISGSSLPYSRHVPPLNLPEKMTIDDAVFVYHHSPERYGYHSFEFAQSIVERRDGGESGIESLTVYTDDCWDRLDAGLWSEPLMQAAIDVQRHVETGVYRENCARPGDGGMATVVRYVDGLEVTHVNLTGHVYNFSVAMRINGEDRILATEPCLKDPGLFTPNFATLCRIIEDSFLTGVHPHAPERNLLTTGLTSAHMQALAQPGVELKTPDLQIAYQPLDAVGVYDVNG